MTPPRLARPTDADSITKLVNQAYGHYIARINRKPIPMTADYLAAIKIHQMWVKETADGIIAVLELIPADTYLLIENIAVAPTHQKQGLGQALMSFAELQAIQQGFNELRLYTNALFIENLAFYKRLSYSETHREPFKGSTVVYMCKQLAE